MNLKIWFSIRINPRTRYIVTGHSLGGALAYLYSMYMVKLQNGYLWKHPGSRLITFGGPRVGDKTFSQVHDKLIPAWKKLRIVNNKDPIPNMIGKFSNFLHASREIWIERKTKYAWQFWRRKKTSHHWHVCPVANGHKMDYSCSNKIWAIHSVFNVKDHLMGGYVSEVEKLGRNRNALKKFLNALC